MASSVSTSMTVKRTHAEMSASKMSAEQNIPAKPSLPSEAVPESHNNEQRVASDSRPVGSAALKISASIDAAKTDSQVSGPAPQLTNGSPAGSVKSGETFNSTLADQSLTVNSTGQSSTADSSDQSSTVDSTNKSSTVGSTNKSSVVDSTIKSSVVDSTIKSSGVDSTIKSSVVDSTDKRKTNEAARNPSRAPVAGAMALTSGFGTTVKSSMEAVEMSAATAGQDTMVKSSIETAASQSRPSTAKNPVKVNNNRAELEDGEEPEKKAKIVSSTSSTNKGGAGKTPEQILELMDKTFDQRRKIITKQMPTIPELKELYPSLFTGKQLLIEFQRITKIDIDQKIQEFCVRYATAVIEMARNKKEADPVLARWEQAKLENDTLRQYWDMVTALCLLPLHFGENFVEMVLEIGEDEEVVPQGKIVPTLVARGNIFCTDEFFLIAENTIVQEFEEFTIAFASLYSSYWVFNMVYPETIETTYNYIQRCIVRQREPGLIPAACKNFTKTLQKWNKDKSGK